MAHSSAYFPPLDKCLAGSDRLVSWKTAYRALYNLDAAYENTTLETFLTDEDSLHLLSNALNPFRQPGTKTKADFETKTAPIHVSQSTNGDYDLELLKKDALWLSEKLEVEELVALRIVILEWQQRAQDQLLASLGNHTDKTSSSNADFTVSTLAASTTNLNASATRAKKLEYDFGVEHIRRSRQLEIYLEEKSHLLKVSTELVNQTTVADQNTKRRKWIDDLSNRVSEQLCRFGDNTAHETFCRSCVQAIDSMLIPLLDSSEIPGVFRSDETHTIMLEAAIFNDITSVLRILLANLSTLNAFPGFSMVSSWFKLMSKTNFFQDVTPSPALPNVDVLQCLVSVVSVAMLRIPEAVSRISRLYESNGAEYPHLEGEQPYYLNETCFKEVNLILYTATRDNAFVASPAVFGWSILASCINDMANFVRSRGDQQRDELSEGEAGTQSMGLERSSRQGLGTETSLFEKLHSHLQEFEMDAAERDEPAIFFAKTSVDTTFAIIPRLSAIVCAAFGSDFEVATTFHSRMALLSLVGQSMMVVAYSAEVIEAIVALLSPEAPCRSTRLDGLLVDFFLSNQTQLRESVLEQAAARYPFELSPLLRLLAALAPASSTKGAGPTDLVELLETMPTLTVMVTEDFRDYELENEDENINSMVLTRYIPLFASKQALGYGDTRLGQQTLTMGTEGQAHSNILSIPAGAIGSVVKESRPLVFRLEHQHSALEYLGLLLCTILPNSEFVTTPPENLLDRSTASEIIILINTLVQTTLAQHQGVEEARERVLGRLSFALPDAQDIVSVIADILEMELLSHLNQSYEDGSLELLISCAEFFDQLASISPERVWSILARSSFLGLAGGASALASVVGGSEVQTGRFRFLSACVKLFSRLIDDTISGLIKRRFKVDRATNRFDSPIPHQDATPERTITAVIKAYQAVMMDAWQSLGEWRFVLQSEKVNITCELLTAFDRLLKSAYGISNESTANNISALLLPAAKDLLDGFAPTSSNGSALQTFGSVFATSYALGDDALPVEEQRSLRAQIDQANQLLTTLTRTPHARAQDVGKQILRFMPYLAFVQGIDHSLKRSTCALLADLVAVVKGDGTSDTPSLLGQLSAEAGKNFLAVISELDRPLKDIETECEIWNFLSSIMASKQQWFAIYLLTGALPKDRLKDPRTLHGKSILTVALDQLCDISTMQPEKAKAMLKFVVTAQSAWVWATNEVRSHPEFFKKTLDWMNGLTPPTRKSKIVEELFLANEHQMAAYLCDILAVNFHAAREIGEKNPLTFVFAKSNVEFSRSLDFLRNHASSADAYNRSLHRNLADNFSRKFHGCQVGDFSRTKANPAPFGRNYFYDIDMADRVLRHESAWKGREYNGRQNGFDDEVARANVNLSLYDAQRNLLKSWRILATTLCDYVKDDQSLQTELALAAVKCMQANSEANLDVPGMDEIVLLRADLAFVLVSNLVGAKIRKEAVKSFLPAVCEFLRMTPVNYDVATAAEDMRYYRTLLQILYLAIQPHAYMQRESQSRSSGQATDETRITYLEPDVAAMLVQVVGKVIAPGFRALCGNLHTNIELATPEDFALLTAILQALLCVRGIDSVHPQITDIIVSSSLIRGALSLYSWSDQLAEVMEQDPVYGEVSILFLLALSTIRPAAEQMALDGVLLQLSSANLSNYFRKVGGRGPFDEPKRMFTIWSEGLLPLCLNLLDAVGPAVAGDVGAFLNEFPEQLARAETSLENVAPSLRSPHAGAVTLGLVHEAHSLCFIGLILESDTLRGSADGINPADVPKLKFDHKKAREDVAGLMRQKTSLASRVVPVSQREEIWRQMDGPGSADNVLMAKIVGEIDEFLQTVD